MQPQIVAAHLGGYRLDQPLALAPADGVAGTDIDHLWPHERTIEIYREPLATQAINRKAGISPSIAAPLYIDGKVGLIHSIHFIYTCRAANIIWRLYHVTLCATWGNRVLGNTMFASSPRLCYTPRRS